MRFIARGPWLPDELLTARDAGQVIFFCGAGVSQAQAKLPNFPDLAGRVLTSLGSGISSPARRLFEASQKFEEETGLTGIVATDRVFGLLEREFDPAEVREAVAEALRPPVGYTLDAHRTMLDLARDKAGVARLITTNFDLLFEQCDPSLGSFNPPRLPDPRREKDFRGIIHIHGCVDSEYRSARDDEFVLSTADFGHAYLSEGWATRYIRALLSQYKVVFVGYSADDPPVQYLLEALNRGTERPNELYAFQAGDVAQAAAQWAHKGVNPIPYESANQHAALWQTLGAWAERARDVDAWYRALGQLSVDGPNRLLPHERGMVVHMAATPDGARRLVAGESLLPASWLCVMDPNCRYDTPRLINPYEQTSERFDPFDALGLDSDRAPEAADPNNHFPKREVPQDAWDLLASTKADRKNLPTEAVGRLRGGDAASSTKLPTRLWHLAMYLCRVAHQPTALWWAAHQESLHPDIVDRIEWSLLQEADRYPPGVRRGWRLLIAAWKERKPTADYRRYGIEALVKQGGWSTELVRATVEIYRPVLVAKAPFASFALLDQPDLAIENMLRLEVEYPRPHAPLVIPQEHLDYAIQLFRAHIEHAVVLEREIRGYNQIYFDITRPNDGEELDEDGFQLTGHLATFINLLTRLAASNPVAVRAEFNRWPRGDNQVFNRLRIWAASQSMILTAAQAAKVFVSLNEELFWTSQHERDLLYALRDRWSEMGENDRQVIEQRLLTGSFPWPEHREDLAVVNAHYRLNRLQWLHDHGVSFFFDFDAKVAEIRCAAPEWVPEFAYRTAQPNVGKVISVVTETDPTPLAGLPINGILAFAQAAARFDFRSNIEHLPFHGLAEERPSVALAVLTDAARKGEFAEREWASMLEATSTGDIKPRLLRTIGLRLSKLKPEHIAALRHPVSEWLRDRATLLIERMPDVFGAVWDRLAEALAAHPPPDRFRRPNTGWVDDGLNQPAGRMVDAHFKDPAKEAFQPGRGLSDAWKVRLDQLLALPGDARRHAIATIAPHSNWLYNVDPEWSERQLISLVEEGDANAQAFWGGYFWAAHTPQIALYMRLKPAFTALARAGTNQRNYANKLAGMFLLGWSGGGAADENALIPDVELREILIHADDDLRIQMLWYLQRWSNEPGSEWGERILPFLRNVWPLQSAVKTPLTSSRLVDFALCMPERFPEIVEVILPRLRPIRGASVQIGPFTDVENGIATKHPRHLLDLLWTVLPIDAWEWPYETGRVLDVLAKQDVVSDDPRLAELRRREQQR